MGSFLFLSAMESIHFSPVSYASETVLFGSSFQVEYFFDPDCEECDIFSVDAATGEIRLITQLVESKDTYTLLVNARDGDSSMPADERNEAPSE